MLSYICRTYNVTDVAYRENPRILYKEMFQKPLTRSARADVCITKWLGLKEKKKTNRKEKIKYFILFVYLISTVGYTQTFEILLNFLACIVSAVAYILNNTNGRTRIKNRLEKYFRESGLCVSMRFSWFGLDVKLTQPIPTLPTIEARPIRIACAKTDWQDFELRKQNCVMADDSYVAYGRPGSRARYNNRERK